MKNSIVCITAIICSISIKANAHNMKADQTYNFVMPKTCFQFYHEIFDTYYGGVNIDNVSDFNYLVAQCQATFE